MTRFQLRLHPVGTILGGALMLPATRRLVASFHRAAEAAPDELSTIANVMTAPPMPFVPKEVHGKLIVMALLAYAGDAARANASLAPFRALATPIADMVRPIPTRRSIRPEDEENRPIPR